MKIGSFIEGIYKDVFLKMRVIKWEHFIMKCGNLARDHFEEGGIVKATYKKRGPQSVRATYEKMGGGAIQ